MVTTQSLTSAIGLEFADSELEAAMRVGLDTVEGELRAAVASADPFVTEAARHLLEAGGKRVRPMLTLLAAHFGDPTAPLVVPSALVLELTHLATLYHDDVMDEAAVRRGAPSANSRWTNTVAILTGDYLFAKAASIAAELGTEAVRIQAETFARLVQGQIRETVGPRAGVDPVAHHLDVHRDKTGSLIATCCRFGALFGGADDKVTDTVTQFGEVFGIAFQLSDDLLDIASESVYSGKVPGTDLREGIATLPVLYALEGPDNRLRQLLAQGPLTDDAEHAEALGLLRRSPAMDRARATLEDYASEARRLLGELPDVPARQALASMCDFVTARMA
ncbi:polyprenyl synthetase family protein [Longispora fulva]|uniref:Heptaprenyl diphosphate synthase n=1 Tax=Longispora fulva TaxID=619741 RepID=A0A8J7GWF1_9ACTN|nr:polyprenyl synthetase family protein [Longispora fulva]MBG6140024.1 heptaprenyl diphosphate synthase [Longispora fulva]